MNLRDPSPEEEVTYTPEGETVDHWSWGGLRVLAYAGVPLTFGVISGGAEAILEFKEAGKINPENVRVAAGVGMTLGLAAVKLMDGFINVHLDPYRRDAQARRITADITSRLGMDVPQNLRK